MSSLVPAASQNRSTESELKARCADLAAEEQVIRAGGGSSAIAEAVTCGIPVICSHIPGNVGMLGRDYPGYFRPEDTTHLSELLEVAEKHEDFLQALRQRIIALQPRFTPEAESASWSRLLKLPSTAEEE